MPCQRQSAVYYLVYLDIWLLLFRSVPTQILLIALTNIASPVCHKSKQDTVVAPSLVPNLNVSAGVSSGTENPYGFCVFSLLYCKLSDIVLSRMWHGVVLPNLQTKPAGKKKRRQYELQSKAYIAPSYNTLPGVSILTPVSRNPFKPTSKKTEIENHSLQAVISLQLTKFRPNSFYGETSEEPLSCYHTWLWFYT